MGSVQSLHVLEDFVGSADCNMILESIAEYRGRHEAPLIVRPERKRPLRYRVINGEEIGRELAGIQSLYERTLGAAQATTGERVVPLQNRKVGVNVNITPPGGAYRWHYDRNAVTAVLYLNEVEGGEIEAYPDHRVLLSGSRSSRMQSYVDRVMQTGILLKVLGRKHTVAPKPGLLVIMRGDRCLHSVREVTGVAERICVVMSFDSAEATFPQEAGLDAYLYSNQATAEKRDPNYAAR